MYPARPTFEWMSASQPVADTNSAALKEAEADSVLHLLYCPNCSSQLTTHRCKLVCTCCGYFMSCADYY
jgi:hypothetical protein